MNEIESFYVKVFFLFKFNSFKALKYLFLNFLGFKNHMKGQNAVKLRLIHPKK